MNKTVVVTGSSSGIGKEIIKSFSDENFNVVVNYNKNKNGALKLVEEIKEKNLNAIAIKADISNIDEANLLIKTTIKEFGKIDILVNNAGISSQMLFTEITPNILEETFKTNVYGAFYCSQCAVKDMLKRHEGKIINISSVWGITGASCEVHYSASKAAIVGLTKSLAKELAPSNITVNCVAPGVIKTKMNEFLNPDETKDLIESIPMGRMGLAEEVAKTVKFLASDDANYLTGQIISPNGGFLI